MPAANPTPNAITNALRTMAFPPVQVSIWPLPGSIPAHDTKDEQEGSICDGPQKFRPA
jgi:hypothetical protein